MDYFFNQKIRKTEKFLRLEGRPFAQGEGFNTHIPAVAHRLFECDVTRCRWPREFVFISTVGRPCFDYILTLFYIIEFLCYLLFAYNILIKISILFNSEYFLIELLNVMILFRFSFFNDSIHSYYIHITMFIHDNN